MSVVRKRPYTKARLVNWTITLDKYGYVPCITSNCPFMAFDCQEMSDHFGECRKPMDPSLLYMCSVCNKGGTKRFSVHNHVIYSHPNEAPDIGFTSYIIECTTEKKISKMIELSWQTLLESRGYIKCFEPYCLFLAEDLTEMRGHYGHCDKFCFESGSYKQCSICNAQTDSQDKLNRHMSRCHPPGTTANTPMNSVSLQMIENWTKLLPLSTYIKCETKFCDFITKDVEELTIHYRFCRNPNRYKFTICRVCHDWLNPSKYNEHIIWHLENKTHPQCEIKQKHSNEMICSGMIFDDEDNELLIVNKLQNTKKYRSGKMRIIPNIPPFDIPSVKNINVKPNIKKITKIDSTDVLEPSDITNIPKLFKKVFFQDNPEPKPDTVPEPEAKIKVRKMKYLKRKKKELVRQYNSNRKKADKSPEPIDFNVVRQYKHSRQNRPVDKSPMKITYMNEPIDVDTGVDSVLKRLGDEIMKQNQSGLHPFEIQINDEIWTVDLPPFEEAERIVKKERESMFQKNLKNSSEILRIFQKSLKHSREILRRTNTVSGVTNSIKEFENKLYPETERIIDPDKNPLLQKILSLEKNPRREPRAFVQHNKQIDIDDPNEMANLLRKYAAEISIQEDNVNRILGLDEDFGCTNECEMDFSEFDCLFRC